MIQLYQAIPDPDLLLALEPEELATKLLFLLRQRGEPMFHPGNLQNEPYQDSISGFFDQNNGLSRYPLEAHGIRGLQR